ncbi:acyltransferase family protein [Hephaestia sp. GCM10023244]|uniref:acyltransferase family protein n=1 Tax=unclassified Hephaestia TaxID=2631281 RepID=UPI0020774333|nr:acyltransferase [Hephaestia sp. MAHUQ-44]MCM8731659.1 acyltransferase [Hephaestia sp. MAHUQ-44]
MAAPASISAGGGAITQLTALRYVAAFAVMLSHLDFLAANTSPAVRATYTLFFHQGFSGVSFFYILSGFIISYAYRDRLLAGTIGTGAYLYRRLTRIVPLHWLTALVFAGWLAVAEADPPHLTTLVLNLGLLHAWFPAMTIHYSLNGPSWSLSDEAFFYVAFLPLVRVPVRGLCWIAALGLAVIAALALASSLTETAYSPTIEWFFYVNPAARLLEFVTGMLLYHVWRAGRGRAFATTAAEVTLIVAVPVAMLGFALLDVPMQFRYQLAYLPLMAALVLVFAYGGGGVTRMLRTRPLVLLGEASFALYLTHRPIITLTHQVLGGRAHGWGDVLLSALLLVVCSAVSIAVFLGFERPILRWSRRARRVPPMGVPAV